jgi:hypothetical protein
MTGLVNPWLIVLNMDIKTLFQKDYRVCSADFDEDDFAYPKRAADPNNPKGVKEEIRCQMDMFNMITSWNDGLGAK